jgi:orotidine-5'-phosphate decarboxylase
MSPLLFRPDGLVSTVCHFNQCIVNETHDVAGAYKLNLGFYLAMEARGIVALSNAIDYIHRLAPEKPVILDGKFGDIPNTNTAYAQATFDGFEADAVTLNPYLGYKALQPFLECKNKGCFILCRTSNDGAEEFQELATPTALLYEHIASHVKNTATWNQHGNCGLVVGATAPEQLKIVRSIVGDTVPILIPGIGAQSGDLEKTVQAGMDQNHQGFLINASRSIIYASSGQDFAEAARRETVTLRNHINLYRSRKGDTQ